MSKKLTKASEAPSVVSFEKIKPALRKRSSSVSKITSKDNEQKEANDKIKDNKFVSKTEFLKKLEKKRSVKEERHRGHVIFKHVYFNTNDHPRSLYDVSLEILSGQRVGIVGEKSYDSNIFAVALFRGKDFYNGNITIDGKSLSSIDATRKIFIVHKNPIFHSDTIRDNLDPFGDASDKKIWDAVEKVGMKTKLTKYGTNLDSSFSFRTLLPIEGQLLSLAIALLKNPSLIIVKEYDTTDSEDDVTKVHDVLNKEFKNITVMFLTVHLTTMQICDKIYYFADGKVVEEGSPARLLSNTSSKISHYLLNQNDALKKKTKLLNLIVHNKPFSTEKYRTPHLSLTKLLNENNIDVLKNIDLNMFNEDDDEIHVNKDLAKESSFVRSAFNMFIDRKSEMGGIKITDITEDKADCKSVNIENIDKSSKRDVTVTVEDCFDAIFQEEIEGITVEECDFNINYDTESKLKELELEIDKDIDDAKRALNQIRFKNFGCVLLNADEIDKPIPDVVHSKKDFSYGIFPQDVVYNTDVDKTTNKSNPYFNDVKHVQISTENANMKKEIRTIKPVATKSVEKTSLKSPSSNLDSVQESDHTTKKPLKLETVFKVKMKPQKYANLQSFIDENQTLFEIEEDAYNKINRVYESNNRASPVFKSEFVEEEEQIRDYDDVEKSVSNIVRKMKHSSENRKIDSKLIRSEETRQNVTKESKADMAEKHNLPKNKETDSNTVNILKNPKLYGDKPKKMGKTKKVDISCNPRSDLIQNFIKAKLPMDNMKEVGSTKIYLNMKTLSETNTQVLTAAGRDKTCSKENMKGFDFKDKVHSVETMNEIPVKGQHLTDHIKNELKLMRAAGASIKDKGNVISKQVSALGNMRK